MNLWAARVICGIRHRVDGVENMPATPHIVMAKHSSTWETLFLTQIFPPLAYVAKRELLSIPFFGWAFRFASPITIDRRAGRDAMEQIAEQGRVRFADGFWIVIYPEGTRIPAGTRAKYKTGGARLAIEMGVTDPTGRAQRRLAVAEGPARQAAGHGNADHRDPDRAGRQGPRAADAGSRGLDRGRGGAARRPRGEARRA